MCDLYCFFVCCVQSDDRGDKIPEFKQIAASLQPVKAALSASSQRSIGTQLALPLKREIGDCYIWGGWGDAEVGALCLGMHEGRGAHASAVPGSRVVGCC